ncbi:hypothetical protein [Nocardioides montaniterrae]
MMRSHPRDRDYGGLDAFGWQPCTPAASLLPDRTPGARHGSRWATPARLYRRMLQVTLRAAALIARLLWALAMACVVECGVVAAAVLMFTVFLLLSIAVLAAT